MGAVAVVSASGKPLMPTNICRARRLLKSGRAVIHKYRPFFTIRMTDREDGNTQPVEVTIDTGYLYIGLDVCSEKHEFVNEQRDLLPDEAENHKSRSKTRRARRGKKRYRKKRFDNRKGRMTKDGFAPSIRNKRDVHIELYKRVCEVFPITSSHFEMGQFDTQVLKAMEEGKPLPEGTDYQQGERYGIATLREAVFTRDSHTCVFCGRGIKDNAVLHVHHIRFWKKDRTNRMSNLAVCCEKCHTAKNHQPGGKLYGVIPKLSTFKGAAFMTAVRWDIQLIFDELVKIGRSIDIASVLEQIGGTI